MSIQIQGNVASIGETGSLVTDIDNEQLTQAPRDESIRIQFGGHETFGLYDANHDQPMGTLVASLGSSGHLEIEIVGISVAEMLGIRIGEAVEVGW